MIAFIVAHLDGSVRAYDKSGTDVTPAHGLGLDALKRLAPNAEVIVMRQGEENTWAFHDDPERYAK